jgi:hypothetical protein
MSRPGIRPRNRRSREARATQRHFRYSETDRCAVGALDGLGWPPVHTSPGRARRCRVGATGWGRLDNADASCGAVFGRRARQPERALLSREASSSLDRQSDCWLVRTTVKLGAHPCVGATEPCVTVLEGPNRCSVAFSKCGPWTSASLIRDAHAPSIWIHRSSTPRA